MKGNIIALLGSPASGKTTLAKKLGEYYNAEVFYEEPEGGFPKEIQDSLATQTHLSETNIWFRNRILENYLKGRALAEMGRNVVLDAGPFYQCDFYIELKALTQFHKDIFYKIGELDRLILPQPDCTIYIETTPETMRTFLEKRSGQYAWEENKEWVEFLLQMPLHCDALMQKVEPEIMNLVKLKRDQFDVYNPEDFKKITGKIDGLLKSSPK